MPKEVIEMARGNGRDRSALDAYKEGQAPWWMYPLERLGVPTFLLLVFLVVGYFTYGDVKEEVRSQNVKLVQVITAVLAEQRVTNQRLEALAEKHR